MSAKLSCHSKSVRLHVTNLIHDWEECTRCAIGNLANRKVHLRGIVPCDILFVGEAPGRDEDREGYPFVGMSGHILQDWIDAARRKIPFSWAITNIVACRPCDCAGGPNRAPSKTEISNCHPHLQHVIRIAKPTGLVLVGRTAQDNLFSISRPTFDIPHPASFIYRPNLTLQMQIPGRIADFAERLLSCRK